MTSANSSEDLHQGRGWLNRAAEMLDGCEDHVSDAEFARAAAAIGNGFVQLAAAEREAAAQAFVDERHAAERAEDLERIAANRTEDLERIAAADAKAWEHQDSEAEVRTAVVEAHRAMTARMQAEQAEIEQRTSALAALDVAALAASGQRKKRAEAEARPHDGEPRGEAAYLLEGDDEIFTAEPKHAVDEGVVWIVADANGPLHAAATQALAQTWVAENRDSYEGLSVTAMELAVDRG